jgi:hypothetical protein
MRWAIRLLVVMLCLGLALPALVSADEPVTSKYNMKIWGRVKMDYTYDNAQFVNYNDFIGVPANSETTSDQKNDSTNFNPRDTRLGFSASHAVEEWAGKGVVELDFYGTNSGDNLIPRMRLAYVDLANKDWGTSIRAGQDWTPILSTNPSTIDFGILTATGNLWWRRPQLTVRQNLDLGDAGGLQFLMSAMLKRRTDTSSETRQPWLLGRAAWNFDFLDGKHLLAANIGYQRDKVSNAAGTADDRLDRYVAGAEAKFGFGPVLIKGEFWIGQGIGGDFLRYDLDTRTNSSGNTKVWDAWGHWVDVTYKIMPKWSVTAGFGMDNPDNSQYKGATSNNRTYKKAYNMYVNTWYTLGPDVKVGFEAMNLQANREDAGGNSFHDNGQRYTTSIYYGF